MKYRIGIDYVLAWEIGWMVMVMVMKQDGQDRYLDPWENER